MQAICKTIPSVFVIDLNRTKYEYSAGMTCFGVTLLGDVEGGGGGGGEGLLFFNYGGKMLLDDMDQVAKSTGTQLSRPLCFTEMR